MGRATWTVLLESDRVREAENKKMFVMFLPHDATPHFEAPPHRNAQQQKGETPFGRPKTDLMRHHSLPVWTPNDIPVRRRKDYPVLNGHSDWLVGPMCSCGLVYAILCGFHDATTSRSENGYGFPFLEKHIEIGSAMLSSVCLYKLTIHATTQADCAANIRWACCS